jgi:phage terminase large subunit-like protein
MENKNFVFADESAETTLELYINKIENYYNNIAVDKKNETKQKIDSLNAILDADLTDI